MASCQISPLDSKKTVKAKHEVHFIKKRNVANTSKQEGKAVDSFITSLYKLSEHCAYGNFRNELIRDCIVIGMRDTSDEREPDFRRKLYLPHQHKYMPSRSRPHIKAR